MDNASPKLYLKINVFVHFFKQLFIYDIVELTTSNIYQ